MFSLVGDFLLLRELAPDLNSDQKTVTVRDRWRILTKMRRNRSGLEESIYEQQFDIFGNERACCLGDGVEIREVHHLCASLLDHAASGGSDIKTKYRKQV